MKKVSKKNNGIKEENEEKELYPLLAMTRPKQSSFKNKILIKSKNKKKKQEKNKYKNSMNDFVPKSTNSNNKSNKLTRISELHGFLSDMNISELLAKTNYNRRELYVMYVRFKALCSMSPTPDGIDRATFKKGVARLSVEDDLFVNRVYDLIDEDNSDSIEWDEFLTVMSALEKGNKTNRKSQISFFFKVYDLDNDGVISRNDLSTMFESSAMLKKDKTTQDLVDAFVRRVFKVVTGNENKNILTEQDVTNYLNGEGANEDVWDLFGRSMLKDFTTRRNV